MTQEALNTKEALSETRYLQRQTRAKLTGMLQQTNEAQEVGVATMEQLENQRRQLDRMQREAGRINEKLDETDKIANKLDFWALKWNNKRIAQSQARAELDRRLEEIDVHRKQQREKTLKKSPKKETGADRRRRRQKKQQKNGTTDKPFSRVPLVRNLDPTLDEDTKRELLQMEQDDQEIDNMLDHLDEDLGRIKEMTLEMGAEVGQHGEQVDKLNDDMDQVREKQFMANMRVKHFLGGKKWFRNHEKPTAPAMITPTIPLIG